mmetsp:Transcript_28311/g.59200  ORF Transcript_28311/g.59200 Transcript_28311/m.59200 type:complete len:110 (-) Transcript_28311:437-766(-)
MKMTCFDRLLSSLPETAAFVVLREQESKIFASVSQLLICWFSQVHDRVKYISEESRKSAQPKQSPEKFHTAASNGVAKKKHATEKSAYKTTHVPGPINVGENSQYGNQQ